MAAVREIELAIIGAGVAGLSAATEAARLGLQVLVIERTGAGGQVMNVEQIDNMPGFDAGVSGFELGPALQERAESAGAEFMLGSVLRLSGDASLHRPHLLHLDDDETVAARAVLVAAGSRLRKLGVPGEQQLQGRGVSQCASCDGPLFRGRTVVVVGGGDSAFGEAAALAVHAARVIVVFAEALPHAQAGLVDRLAGLMNVELLGGMCVEGIDGDDAVTGVRLREGGVEGGVEGGAAPRTLAADGVFVYAGLQADTGFLGGALKLDAAGRIETDATLHSSLRGVFAAGDVRAGAPCLLAAAAAEGVAAARAIHDHLRAARHEGGRP